MAQEAAGSDRPSTNAAAMDGPDPRTTLQRVLAPASDQRDTQRAAIEALVEPKIEPAADPAGEVPKASTEVAPTEDGSRAEASADEDEDAPHYTSTTTTTRRNANGSVSSVFSGNKIRHLKKPDGEPLWRGDIQLAFLKAVFEDPTRCFTSTFDSSPGHTFSEIYIETMAKSSKSSKVLKDKLENDRTAAVNMAMICLLVNVGRMNTTLNFFPEMRAALRTYHSIPSLQAQHAGQASKQLQDAPRLKSILKGAMEDKNQPSTINEIIQRSRPRTNPVNLIFVLAQYAPKISEMHFFLPRDFFDLVMRSTLSSNSRAKAFLWLMWWYLESDFSTEDSQANPFGKGLEGPGSKGKSVKVPFFENLTQEQADAENVDTPEEIAYGKAKKAERDIILSTGVPPSGTTLKRLQKTPEYRFNPPITPGDDAGNSDAMDRPSSSMRHDSEYHSSSPGREDGYPTKRKSGNVYQLHMAHDDQSSGPRDGPGSPPTSTSRKGVGRGNWIRSKGRRDSGHQSANGTATRMKPSTTLSMNADDYDASSQGINGVTLQSGSRTDTGRVSSTSLQMPILGTRTGRGPRTIHQKNAETRRQKRVAKKLEDKLTGIQVGKADEQRARGVLVDAWIKASLVPSGWESNEEEGTLGGFDESIGNRMGDVGARATKVEAALVKWGVWMEIQRHGSRRKAGHLEDRWRERVTIATHLSNIAELDVPARGRIVRPKTGGRTKKEDSDVDMADRVEKRPYRRRVGVNGTRRKRAAGQAAATEGEAADDAEDTADPGDGGDGGDADDAGEDLDAGDDGEMDDMDRELLAQADGDETASDSGSDQEEMVDEDTIMAEG